MDKDQVLDDIFKNDPLGLLDIKPKPSLIKDEDSRLLEAFEEINQFVSDHDREPLQSGGITEKNLYFRLKGMREQSNLPQAILAKDFHNLFSAPTKTIKIPESIDDIFSSDDFGVLESDDSIFELKHVPKEQDMPDYIARRKPCDNFESFEPLFIQCQTELRSGKRSLLSFRKEQQIDEGQFFVLKGVLLYVASVGNRELENGKTNARLQCVFENGTESDMLLRSLAAELYKNGKRVVSNNADDLALFTSENSEDVSTGYIYILRSESKDPKIKGIENLYKIGFSQINVEDRIKNAQQDPTFLMAPVAIVSVYQCLNMNPQKFEQLLHTFFAKVCLNIDIFDEYGKRYIPREWFIVPLESIQVAITLILNGEIVHYVYDTDTQSIELTPEKK
ncbi:MAG: GIY-YIG nuclease family protein [Desulfobacteraceae bacterium]|nr:GIY-YIG nuclease family protein [Desulfobacteraceae bacterium]